MSEEIPPKNSNFSVATLLLLIVGFSLYSMASFFNSNSKALEVSVLQNIKLASAPPDCGTCPPTRYEPPKSQTIPKETPVSTTQPEITVPTTPPPKPKPYRPYVPPTPEVETFILPELTPEQKKLEDEGLNPFLKNSEQSKVEIDIAAKDTEKEIKNELEEELDKDIEITNTDGETVKVGKTTKVVVALTSEDAKEKRAKLNREKDTLLITYTSDSDGDGVSDIAEERIHKTNPFNSDSDGDGAPDNVEILEFKSDPLKSSKPDFTPRVTNLDNNKVSDTPPLKGVGEPGEKVSIEAKSVDTGETKTICETTADANGKFICIPKEKLSDGKHYLYSNHEGTTEREIALIDVNEARAAEAPKAEVASKTKDTVTAKIDHTKDWMTTFMGKSIYGKYFAQTVEKISDTDKIEKLIGQAEPGQIIIITWQSLLYSSTVIADASQGNFEAMIPKELEKGEHTIFVYAYYPETKFLSKLRTIIFTKS